MRVPLLMIASIAGLAGCGPQGPSQADIMAGRDGTEGAPPTGQSPAPAGSPDPAIMPQHGLSVVLTGYGDNKISVIRAVMDARPGLGLADAKALVESAPQPVQTGLSAADATALKASLEAAGGSVQIN